MPRATTRQRSQLDLKALTIKGLCDLYVGDLKAGLILGKGGRPKKTSTSTVDFGRIERRIVPLIGKRRVKDLTKCGYFRASEIRLSPEIDATL
ncbi:hypothetical protein [Rhodobacter sp. SGA-6-6]|uniref:hypothetical protein n=1 Tax=Rhodobacter sp. SGA-6-6 TaxID=2710882 RepID=UPI001F108C32|nr:hypothetical protein [Rhodobacter sp. SGA-6-6]